tara:strand:+ start:223 stop:870 length:648 start_codon:yes stop_codon:yes gene_type:complete
MAEDKKGFVLYADLIHTLGKMPDDKAGELFKHILSYVNDQDPVTDDLIIQLTFEPIKQQLKRDLKKYDEIKLKRSDAGKESARLKALKKKQQDKQKSTSVESVQQDSTNPTVRDTVNDNVNVNISFIDKMDLFKKKVGEDGNVIWRDNVYRMHKIQKGKLFRVVEQFTIHLAIQNNGVYTENFAEFRRHCSNWIGTSIQNGKLSEFRTVKAIGSI